MCTTYNIQENQEIQRLSCKLLVTAARPIGCLEGTAFQGEEETLSLTSQIGQLGGIDLILKAMDVHEHDSATQAMSCWALVNLALVPQQKTQIIENGGMKRIVRAMRLHPEDRDVQFRAILSLVRNQP